MDKFLEKLRVDMEEAILDETKEIIKQVGEEHIYAAALVLDSDCISIYMGVNTKEYLEKTNRDCLEMLKEETNRDCLEMLKEDFLQTKWTPDEWGYDGGKEGKTVDISRQMFEMEEKASDEYEKRKNEIIDIVIDAFDKVIQMKYFDNESVTFFVSIVDDDEGYEVEINSSKRLNSERLHTIFVRERTEPICEE